MPFIHFIVYGIGKPLLELDLLPRSLRDNGTGFVGHVISGNPLNLINLGLALFRAVDELNEGPKIRRPSTYVYVLLKARARERVS